jgi:hypothetical protein
MLRRYRPLQWQHMSRESWQAATCESLGIVRIFETLVTGRCSLLVTSSTARKQLSRPTVCKSKGMMEMANCNELFSPGAVRATSTSIAVASRLKEKGDNVRKYQRHAPSKHVRLCQTPPMTIPRCDLRLVYRGPDTRYLPFASAYPDRLSRETCSTINHSCPGILSVLHRSLLLGSLVTIISNV